MMSTGRGRVLLVNEVKASGAASRSAPRPMNTSSPTDEALHPTAYSLRSCLASLRASGGGRAWSMGAGFPSFLWISIDF